MNHSITRRNLAVALTFSALLFLTLSPARAQQYSAWSAPQNLGATINTTAAESLPFIAPDNLNLFFGSDRAGGSGLTDIYVSTRASANAPWGTPVNLGTNVNSSSVESGPTITADGLNLFFYSNRAGGCGSDDIYVSHRLNNQSGWEPAINLGCQFNSPQSDMVTSFFTDNNETTYLYFCTDRPGGPGSMDIYVSTLQPNGAFGTPVLVEGLNTASLDHRPNIRRDGLEIFFESNRPDTLGGTDLYSSTRETTSSAWSTPVNLGATVNSVSNEGRPSRSFDGRELYFQSNRPGGFGGADIYVTRRSTLTPPVQGFEGDVADRFTGDGMLLANDVTLIRQFVVGNLIPNPLFNEFQRADSSPSATGGDGQLDATDIVQERRYVAGLDTPQPGGGPLTATGSPLTFLTNQDLGNIFESMRTLRIRSVSASAGSRVSVPIELDASGDEVAASFTLNFDPTKLSNPVLTLSAGASADTTLTVNTAVNGRVMVLVDAGSALSKQLVNITFDVAPNTSPGATYVRFANDPTPASISDAAGQRLAASYEDGTVTITGPNTTGVEVSGRVLTPDERGLRNARVTITDQNGVTRTVTTSSFGFYSFEDVEAGQSYFIGVSSRRYRFASRVVNVSDTLADVDFVGQE